LHSTSGAAASSGGDPLTTLREYRALAPWGLRDLSAVSGAILEASAVVPVNAAAASRPSERTIRFYVMRGLVSPPEGRGTAAVYSYRHLLQVLAVKLRQMEGATLETIAREAAGFTGDVIERRVAVALGASLVPPGGLRLLRDPGTARGRVGRALQGWFAVPETLDPSGPASCRRIPVAPGVEVLIDEEHPLLRTGVEAAAIADALRERLARLMPGMDTE
jgi:hypothetical protein